ncbi:hypothetical protein PS6_006217 [Mucor atramentarius]
MSDHHHLSSNENQHQHPQEFCPFIAQSSTESPSTTASPISPMTTIVHQNQSWPSIGQAIDQRHYYYDINQLPQHQHQLQDQYWPNAYDSDPNYPHSNHPLQQQQQQHQHQHQQHFQHYYPESSYTPPAPPPHHHQQSSSNMAMPVPSFYTTQQTMNNSFNAPMPNIEVPFSDPPSTSAAPSIDGMQPIHYKIKEKKKHPQKQSNERSMTDSSPSETPMPSPIIGGKRKRRASTTITSQVQRKKRIQNDTKDTPKEEASSHGSHDEGDGDNGVTTTTTTTTRRVDATKDTYSNQTVDQLENELAFLRDECATILIMLDSLRNAFLADIPSTSASTSAAKSNSSSTTINFMIENVGSLSSVKTSTMQHHVDTSSAATNNGDKRRRSKAMAQNAEMEREMRFAYDDLMLQVRQLEKKVERLEGKKDSPNNNNKRKHDNQMANLKDDIHVLQQENTENDYGVGNTDDDDAADDSGEDGSSNPKGI